MRARRQHSVEFKQQIVEQLMSGAATLGQLSRQHSLSASLIQTWREKYRGGGLIEKPSREEQVLKARVAELERMVGRLAMENDLLKKADAYIRQQRNASSRVITAKDLGAPNGRAKS